MSQHSQKSESLFVGGSSGGWFLLVGWSQYSDGIVITKLSMAMVMHIKTLMMKKAKKLRRKRLRSTRRSSSSIRREELKVGCGVAQNPKQAFTIA